MIFFDYENYGSREKQNTNLKIETLIRFCLITPEWLWGRLSADVLCPASICDHNNLAKWYFSHKTECHENKCVPSTISTLTEFLVCKSLG